MIRPSPTNLFKHINDDSGFSYEDQLDVIDIDPPYNSAARDWKYNNDYVDKTDKIELASEHSEELPFATLWGR